MKIQLLLTGNELMSGHTVDSNSAMIANILSDRAYTINRKVTVGDAFSELVDEIQYMSQHSDVLIVNGGLGPTIDDLTAQALSKVTNKPLQQHAIALEHLETWCGKRKLALNEANLKQAQLPEGVNIVPNPVGSAVGFSIEHNDCLIICTPGVPSELKLMMQESILETISQQFPNNQQLSTIRLQTFGMGESNLQQLVSTHCSDWPEQVELGFRAGLPLLEIKLTIQNPQHQHLQKHCYERLNRLMGDYIIGENDTNLASSVIALLDQAGKKITTAESCTGGLIASSITGVAGASQVFEAGFVTYSNTMKQQLLAVDEQLLEQHGAVSEEVVIAMAEGALLSSKADYAIAVSGVAGPDGGSAEKPVGTVWIAWGKAKQLKTKCLHFNVNRQWFQQIVAASTLDLIRRELLGINTVPRYFKEKPKASKA